MFRSGIFGKIQSRVNQREQQKWLDGYSAAKPTLTDSTVDRVYSAYGLRLSSDIPIPGLMVSRGAANADVRVWLHEYPHWLCGLRDTIPKVFYASPSKNERGTPTLIVWKLTGGAYFRLQYCDGTEFIVDKFGTKIHGTWPDALTLEDATTYLLGPVLGFVLLLRGVIALHSSAVAVGGRAVALLGPPGAGKSTTAAAFAKLEYPVLSDDVVALSEEKDLFLVPPGYPRLCLWPDSVTPLCGSPEALPRLTPNWDKRYLALGKDTYRFQENPLPLAAIYYLRESSADLVAPRVEPLSPQAGFMVLVSNTYMNYLLDSAMREREFRVLGRVVASVPVRQVRRCSNGNSVSELCDALLKDFHGLHPSAAARVPTPVGSASRELASR